jgi:hypothetical protein
MHRLLPAIALLLIGCAALAQPGPEKPQHAERQAAREQLRGELRGATRLPRHEGSHPLDASGSVEAPKTATPARHLTPSERAEMRQQLRQEQFDNKKVRQ